MLVFYTLQPQQRGLIKPPWINLPRREVRKGMKGKGMKVSKIALFSQPTHNFPHDLTSFLLIYLFK